MKVRVIHDFKDKEADLKLRQVGETFETNKERAEYLAKMKAVEAVEAKEKKTDQQRGGDPVSPFETQGEASFSYVRK